MYIAPGTLQVLPGMGINEVGFSKVKVHKVHWPNEMFNIVSPYTSLIFCFLAEHE